MKRSNILSKPVVALFGVLILFGALVIAGCSSNGQSASTDSKPAEEQTQTTEKTKVRVASLKGPTSIGLVSLMDQAKKGELPYDYEFTIATAADEITPALLKGDIDIALVPANVASIMYNKSESGATVIDINTLGVLNVVTGDESISSFADLAGKTIYMTGKGANPEYTMNYLLEQTGIADSVTLEFKDEPTEVVSVLSQDPTAIGVLPQPFATVATTKNDTLKSVIDLTDVWNNTVTDGSQLITGVTVANKEFLNRNKDIVNSFLKSHKDSVDAANNNAKETAPLVVEAGIIDSEAIAAKAIPSCHLVCITGDEMKTSLSSYLKTLLDADPSSIGGTLPGDNFYYVN